MQGKQEEGVSVMFAPRKRRRAFTLVELLVVIVIIGVLMGLLMPAVNAARQSARKTGCINHQKELGLAILQYEAAKHQFPGSINLLQGASFVNSNRQPQPREVSWVVVILEYLGQNDVSERWRSDPSATGTPLQQLVCPSDFDASALAPNAPLSYVVNPAICKYRGLDANRNVDPALLAKNKVSAADVKSPQQTVLLSERLGGAAYLLKNSNELPLNPKNCQSPTGYTSPLPTGPWDWPPQDWPPSPQQTNPPLPLWAKALPLCMVWEDADGIPFPKDGNGKPFPPLGRFSLNTPNDPNDPTRPDNWSWLKSNHPRGVVVTFCDGHVDFVKGATPCDPNRRSDAKDTYPRYFWAP